jgi:hypothetical protein
MKNLVKIEISINFNHLDAFYNEIYDLKPCRKYHSIDVAEEPGVDPFDLSPGVSPGGNLHGQDTLLEQLLTLISFSLVLAHD